MFRQSFQEPVQRYASAGEVPHYQGIAPAVQPPPSKLVDYQNMASTMSYRAAFYTGFLPDLAPTRRVELDSSYSYTLCGIWIGISLMFVTFGSIIVLGAFCAIINAESFPNIQAFHQVAAGNDQTFKLGMALYVLSVCALFCQQWGSLAFEDCWWACMQIFCGVQSVFFASMIGARSIMHVVKLLVRACQSVFWAGGRENRGDRDEDDMSDAQNVLW